MNQDAVIGPNLLYCTLLIALLSGIALTMWQQSRLRRMRVRAQRARRRSAVVHRYDR